MKSASHFVFVLLYFCCRFTNVVPYDPKYPIAYTKYGPILGLIEHSRNAREYMSFRGIPYAKPPVDELRFKAPEPPETWSFPMNGTKEAPFCIQKNYFFSEPKIEGDEDCLYLNVYVPKTDSSRLLPVMVFIHWGGFFAGRGSSDYIGPEYFMDKDIILVTFNYRLGVFGFFSTLDDFAPGNFGLKDQVLALKFVQENIECFGGDKSRVTLFGQSAGSGSVSLHLISPSSKGLFQQAISQSGVALDLWAKPLNTIQTTVAAGLAKLAGCSEQANKTETLVKCLRKVEATQLAGTADGFKYFSIEPLTPFTLVTEKQTIANPYPFLTKDPLEYLQAGEFMKIPWIVGNTQDEGILRVSPLLRQSETRQALNSGFDTLIQQMLALGISAGANATSLLKNITKFYLDGNSFIDINNPSSVQGFINLYSDRSFLYGIHQAVILQSKKGHKPIWMYNFDYKGEYSYGDKFAATNETINFPWGVSHCDDLLYLFRSPALFPDLQKEADLAMSESLVTLWTNFAIYGDPDPHHIVKWKSLNFSSTSNTTLENLNVLNISGNHKISSQISFLPQKSQYIDRMRFWAQQTILENFPDFK